MDGPTHGLNLLTCGIAARSLTRAAVALNLNSTITTLQ